MTTAFTRGCIACTVLNNSGVTQFTLKSNIADAFTTLACTIIEAVVAAIFHLTTFSGPITNATTCTINTSTMSFLFVTVSWTLWSAAVNTSPGSKTFNDISIVDHTVSWAYVFGIA
jgi:hypothetical protein